MKIYECIIKIGSNTKYELMLKYIFFRISCCINKRKWKLIFVWYWYENYKNGVISKNDEELNTILVEYFIIFVSIKYHSDN